MKKYDDGYILADTLAALILILIIVSYIAVSLDNSFHSFDRMKERTDILIEKENSFSGEIYDCGRKE